MGDVIVTNFYAMATTRRLGQTSIYKHCIYRSDEAEGANLSCHLIVQVTYKLPVRAQPV